MDTRNSIRRARPLLGTFVEIGATGAAGLNLQGAVDQAFAAVAQVHRLMSFHDPASDVSRLNREGCAGPVSVHAWTYEVLQTALEMHRESGGIFDISVARLLQRRGLLPGGTHGDEPGRQRASTADTIELRRDGRVRYRCPGINIDLGGIAKGFAVDRAVDVLREHGVKAGLVNAGGDLAVFGDQPELIEVRDPGDARRSLCRVALDNAALASSALRFDPFRSVDSQACAIFDPHNERPVDAIAGATICAPCGVIADALTKVVMIAGECAGTLLDRYRASALFVLESGDVWITPDWQNAVRLAA